MRQTQTYQPVVSQGWIPVGFFLFFFPPLVMMMVTMMMTTIDENEASRWVGE